MGRYQVGTSTRGYKRATQPCCLYKSRIRGLCEDTRLSTIPLKLSWIEVPLRASMIVWGAGSLERQELPASR